MILDAARLAASQLFSREFRAVFFKSIGLTLLVLVLMWAALRSLFDTYALTWIDVAVPGYEGWVDWVNFIAAIAAGIGLAIALALLIAPVTAIIAGIFLDDVAEAVEKNDYPSDPPGKAMPMLPAILISVKFFLVVIAGNILALVLLLLPGINIVAFFLVNGYLLGREFFEFSAMRFRSEADAKALRRRHAGTIFVSGLVIAAFLAVPLLNLLTPLFAAAMMVHLHKAISMREAARQRRAF